jgi:TetR/AcrR family transcriptional regulator, tetracycline repressor protein
MERQLGRESGASLSPARRGVTREKVVREAVKFLNRDGLDGLTMRGLAGRMRIKAASLYNHVHSKEELLILVADSICAELQIGEASRDWRKFLNETAIQFRRVLLSHRDGARVLAKTAPLGPNRLRLMEAVLTSLVRGGFSSVDATDAASVHNSFVVGFVLDETLGRTDASVEVEQLNERDTAWWKSFSSDQYPTILALADKLFDATPDRRFAFGIHALLDGFEARLLRKKRTLAARKHPITG